MKSEFPVRIGVLMIVTDPTGVHILLGVRKNAYQAGLYGLPGGRLDVEETLESCAKRELLEETNLIAKKATYLGVVREGQALNLPKEKRYDFIHFVYLCDSFTGTLTLVEPEKCEGWEWISLEKIPQNTMISHQGAINLLHEFKQKKSSYLVDWPHSK